MTRKTHHARRAHVSWPAMARVGRLGRQRARRGPQVGGRPFDAVISGFFGVVQKLLFWLLNASG